MKYGAICQNSGRLLYVYQSSTVIMEGPPDTILVGLVDESEPILGSVMITEEGWQETTPDVMMPVMATTAQIWRRFNELDSSPIDISGRLFAADAESLNRLNQVSESLSGLDQDRVVWPDSDGNPHVFEWEGFVAFAACLNREKAKRTLHLQEVAMRLQQTPVPVTDLLDSSVWLD